MRDLGIKLTLSLSYQRTFYNVLRWGRKLILIGSFWIEKIAVNDQHEMIACHAVGFRKAQLLQFHLG